jgi:stearoyl-CoA desaturase (Delta-9 desaturase)
MHTVPPTTHDHGHDDTVYPGKYLFVGIHLACFAAIWSGISTTAVVLAITLYVARMFGVTAGYHRYFSHRSFKTGRVMQFLLAFLAQSSAQKGVLWWASKHRHHHRYSDTEHDVHSPRHDGFWHSHVGWIFAPQWDETDMSAVPDLAAYPELVWLNKYEHVPTITLIALCALIGGWSGLVVGFCWSTVATWHGTFMINSLAHVHGKQRYVTGDDSRNNWWLALITLGEGWHNNHHAYQRSTRQGFRWYEVDVTYYVLAAMSWMGLVWDLGAPPPEVVRNERPVGKAVLEKVARQLAASFNIEQLALDIRRKQASAHQQLADFRHSAEDRLADMKHVAADHLADMKHVASDHLADMKHSAADHLADAMAHVHWPSFPSRDELRARAQAMLPSSPSLDAIVARAHELLAERVAERLVGPAIA